MEEVRCNLCGENLPAPWLMTKDRFSGQTFQLVVCQVCGLIYLSPRPSMEELTAYYPDEYEAYQPSVEEMSTTHAWHVGRMWKMQTDYVQQFKPKPGKLLDIGSATGEFLSTARDQGWKVVGIEMVEKSAQKARTRFNLDVITGTLDMVDFPESSFDVITMWDVLEHLPNPQMALLHCRRLLKSDGVIIFSIPNLISFDRYIFGRWWIGWDAPRHFTLFTHETLQKMLEKTGYSIINHDCFLGGKGTFLLSLNNVLGSTRLDRQVKRVYPLISAFLWPYRQISYLMGRGPILAVAAYKQEEK